MFSVAFLNFRIFFLSLGNTLSNFVKPRGLFCKMSGLSKSLPAPSPCSISQRRLPARPRSCLLLCSSAIKPGVVRLSSSLSFRARAQPPWPPPAKLRCAAATLHPSSRQRHPQTRLTPIKLHEETAPQTGNGAVSILMFLGQPSPPTTMTPQ